MYNLLYCTECTCITHSQNDDNILHFAIKCRHLKRTLLYIVFHKNILCFSLSCKKTCKVQYSTVCLVFIKLNYTILLIQIVYIRVHTQVQYSRVHCMQYNTPDCLLYCLQDRPPRCEKPKVCNLWHKSGVRYAAISSELRVIGTNTHLVDYFHYITCMPNLTLLCSPVNP